MIFKYQINLDINQKSGSKENFICLPVVGSTKESAAACNFNLSDFKPYNSSPSMGTLSPSGCAACTRS